MDVTLKKKRKRETPYHMLLLLMNDIFQMVLKHELLFITAAWAARRGPRLFVSQRCGCDPPSI